MLKYDVYILFAIAFSGILIKLFLGQSISNSGDVGPANSVIWGYGTICFSLLGFLFLTFALATKSDMNDSAFSFLKIIFQTSFPIMFLIGALIWVIYLNVAYFNQINQGKVASEYSQFSTLSSFFILIQLLIIFNFMKNKSHISPPNTNDISRLMDNQLVLFGYLVGIVNYVLIGILQIILEYFSTDG